MVVRPFERAFSGRSPRTLALATSSSFPDGSRRSKCRVELVNFDVTPDAKDAKEAA